METNQTSPDKKNIVVPVLFIILALTAAVFFIRFAKKKTATPPKPETKMNIRIAYPALGTVISGQVGTVLQNTDTLAKNGLSADITPMNTGKEMKLALVGNQVDVILTSESNFVVLLGQGFKCYAIASLGSDGKMGLVVNEDSGIKNLSDLKNKKIGTLFGTSVHRPAVQWAVEGGLTPGKDVEIVNFGGAEALRVALASKNVDAIVTWDPYLQDGINKKVHKEIVSAGLDLIVVVSKDYADKNPEAVTKLRQSLKDALLYTAQHKQEVSTWYGKLSKLDNALIEEASRSNTNYNATRTADINIAVTQPLIDKLIGQADFLYSEKLIGEKPEITPYIKQ